MTRKCNPQDAFYRPENTAGHGSPGLPNGLEPPPVYAALIEEVNIAQEDLNASVRILDDGRVNINIGVNQDDLSNLLVPTYEEHQQDLVADKDHIVPETSTPQLLTDSQVGPKAPSLNVVIHVVGSRGDVQPFIALGRVLKETYDHRVRLATHPIFQGFVEENGLEFFSIGGDPTSLMGFMVNNPRLMPSMETIRGPVLKKRRREIFEIMRGCWRSCFEPGDGTDTDHDAVPLRGVRKEFVADAIIANPPSFAHLHCAQKLGIPLHLMFTMPWSATQVFPHPLANIQRSNVDASLKNFMSYPMVEMMIWQLLGGTINMFRSRVLDLEPVRILWGAKGVSKLKIPHTYFWSPSLIPKPHDWGTHMSVTGFSFLPTTFHYLPSPDLEAFLAAGPKPIYVGFGSIVVTDPDALLQIIVEAVRRSGQRALILSSWGRLSAETVPQGIFFVDNVPHDWLFARVSCVVHHGGAGTTAAGIRLGKPTVIVPFFGDQFFWGSTIARAGAGPRPIPFRELNADKLTTAIESALSPKIRRNARELGWRIESEYGADRSASNFHQHLEVEMLRCSLDPSRNAVWKVRRSNIRVSAFCATVLIDAGLLRFKDLNLYRPREYDLEDGPWDPITGTISACLNMISSMMTGFAHVPLEIRRARKPKGVQAPLSQNGEDSQVSNDTETNHWRRSRVQPTTPKSHHMPSSPQSDKVLTISDALSCISTSSSDAGFGDLYADSNQSHEGEGTDLSPAMTEGSNPADAIPKRHFRILQTSNGLIIGTSKAIGKIIVAGIKSPFEVSLSAARGFHNAPRLYGDETVRPQERITGVWSGLKAAGKGLTFGLYDGVSGLWMQPIEGQKKEGALGVLKGVGQGIGGLALKPSAGTLGVIGYTFEGVNKDIQKLVGSNTDTHIITSRKAQGFEEFRSAAAEQKALVIERWRSIRANI